VAATHHSLRSTTSVAAEASGSEEDEEMMVEMDATALASMGAAQNRRT
jgi:hypothetical protein